MTQPKTYPQKRDPQKQKTQRKLDEALEQTFPASDPVAVGSSIAEEEDPRPEEGTSRAPLPPADSGKDHGGGMA